MVDFPLEQDKRKLYFWSGILWAVEYSGDWNESPYTIALCPKNKCITKLIKSRENYSIGEYKYKCIKCDFKITLDKEIEKKGADLLEIISSEKYKNAEIVNIDGELIRVQKDTVKDENYWLDVSLSKNKKGQLQLMVLAGERNGAHKSQLFLDIDNQKLSFDQNNSHPAEIFTKVQATFKKSISEIESKNSNM